MIIKHKRFFPLYFFAILFLHNCKNSHDIVYCKSAYAKDFFTSNILDDGKVYTPLMYKNKMLSASITDTNEIKNRTITDDFRVDVIYYGEGGLYGFILFSLSSSKHYEIISIDKGRQNCCKKIVKGKVYKMSISPYFNRPENTYAWETAEPVYIDGKYVVPAYYYGVSNIYLTSNIKGLYYIPDSEIY